MALRDAWSWSSCDMNCFKNVFIHIIAVHFLYHFWYRYSSKTLFELLHVGEFRLRIHICDHMFPVWFQYNIINIAISHLEKFYVLHLCSIFGRAFLVLKVLFRDREDSFCAQVLSRQAQKPMFVSQNLQKLHAVTNIPVCSSKAMGNEGGVT